MSLKMRSSGTEIKDVSIKGCPFCGNKDLEITDEETYNKLCEENGSALIGVECHECATENKVYDIPQNNYWIGVGMIIAKWNVRVKQ